MKMSSGLENCTRPLVFTSASGCRASENFDISSKNYFFPMYANIFCDAGQVPISRYFKACSECPTTLSISHDLHIDRKLLIDPLPKG